MKGTEMYLVSFKSFLLFNNNNKNIYGSLRPFTSLQQISWDHGHSENMKLGLCYQSVVASGT